MSTRTDPLSRPTVPPDRPHYALGTLLDAEDFVAEQTYHRGRLARALAYLHGSGTLAGLKVTVERPEEGERGAEDGERVTVAPGLAVDRLGRLIEVPRPACIRLGRWLRGKEASRRAAAFVEESPGAPRGHLLVDVFVRFVLCERGKTPAFASGPFDALDAVAPSRLRDGYELSLHLREDPDARLPGDPWRDLLEDEPPREVLRSLPDAILATPWTGGTESRDRDGLTRGPEHGETQPAEDLFLARLRVPVEGRTDPSRTAAEERDVEIDNRSRRFVYPPGLLTAWLDWKLGGLSGE